MLEFCKSSSEGFKIKALTDLITLLNANEKNCAVVMECTEFNMWILDVLLKL